MKRMLLGLVALLAVTLGGALDYSLAAKAAGPQYGAGDHLRARTAFVQKLLPQGDLARALPAPPPGWTVREGRDDDSFTVSRLPVDPVQLEQSLALEAAMTASVKGVQVERRLYENGDQAIYLDVTFVPANAKATRGSQMMAFLFATLASQAAPPADTDSFAPQRLSLPELGAANLYFAAVEGQIYVSALSSADEGVTLDLFHGLDRAALRQMLVEDPTIGKDPVVEDPVATVEKPEKTAPCTSRGAAKFCGTGG
jgi:hypothetical protein